MDMLDEVKDVKMEEPKEKSRYKFQIGDFVKIIHPRIADQAGGHNPKMDQYKGMNFYIKELVKNNRDSYYLDGVDFIWDVRCLRRLRKSKVVVQPVVEQKKEPHQQFKGGDFVRVVKKVSNPSVGHWTVAQERVLKAGEILTVEAVFAQQYPDMAYVYLEEVRMHFANTALQLCSKEEVEKYKKDRDEKRKQKLIELSKNGIVSPIQSHAAEAMKNRAVGTCSFFLEFNNGRIENHIAAACHAQLPTYSGVTNCLFEVAKHTDGYNDKMKEQYKLFVSYILFESPWRNCFRTPSLDHVFKWGVMANMDRPMEEIMGAAVALRGASEFDEELSNFCRFRESGLSGHAAYLLAYAMQGKDDNYTYKGIINAHRVLSYDQGMAGVIRFFREGYYLTKDKKPAKQQSRASEYGIARHIAKGEPGNSIHWFFEKRFPKEGAKFGEKYKSYNFQDVFNVGIEIDAMLFN